ncbi:hypothetical protein C8N43_3170 [Litoreibacter ponti]|uniref:Uncharacterized protein n=2 Tax=Litoreibacter ponti TaxID=1510457 RepID=A0A2T6BE75_9RHOB|nr:hypothetical protein C8N43_3170 [Litoreibacter ponti]
MLLDSGLSSILEGFAIWVVAQPIILLVALFAMPAGALLRMVLGLAFERPRAVALISGAFIGLCGSVFVLFSTEDGWSAWLQVISVGLLAGIFGGWTWWRIEKPFLDR